MNSELKNTINLIDSISLKEMDEVRLLDRTDTKYVININQLPSIINEIKNDYYILTIDDKKVFGYESLYFDTTDLKMFTAHHNGKLNRFKIRKREYTDSKLNFLEIKIKTNKGRTIKERICNEELSKSLSPRAKEFIVANSPFEPDKLHGQIYTLFNRFTLVNKLKNERVTIDFDLKFKNGTNSESIPFIAIIEAKQNKFNKGSKLIETLKKNKILPSGFSKYAYGTAILNVDIKRNNFKPKLLKLKKLNYV